MVRLSSVSLFKLFNNAENFFQRNQYVWGFWHLNGVCLSVAEWLIRDPKERAPMGGSIIRALCGNALLIRFRGFLFFLYHGARLKFTSNR